MSSGNDDKFDPDMFNLDDGSELGPLDAPNDGAEAPDPLGDLSDLGLPAAEGAPGALPEAEGESDAVPAVDGAVIAENDAGDTSKKGKKAAKKKKREKKAKEPRAKKKEKAPRPKREPSGEGRSPIEIAVYATCGLGGLILLTLNVLCFMWYGASSIMFSIFLDLFGAVILAVPFLCWVGRKTLNFYEICLGLTVVAMAIATTLLLIEISRYGGDMKASQASNRAPGSSSLDSGAWRPPSALA